MASTDLEGIMKQAEALPPDEQLRLIAHLAEKVRQAYGVAPVRRRWSELRGAAQYPMVREDAQDWVSQERVESDKGRRWDGERPS